MCFILLHCQHKALQIKINLIPRRATTEWSCDTFLRIVETFSAIAN